jgi:hypothetical protein
LSSATLAALYAWDSSTHTYSTDPWDPSTGKGIRLANVGSMYPPARSWSVAAYNNADQGAVVNLVAYASPDGPGAVVASATLQPGSSAVLAPDQPLAAQYVTVQVSYTAAPTALVNSSLPYTFLAYIVTAP